MNFFIYIYLSLFIGDEIRFHFFDEIKHFSDFNYNSFNDETLKKNKKSKNYKLKNENSEIYLFHKNRYIEKIPFYGEYNDFIKNYIDLYSNSWRKSFQRVIGRGFQYKEMIENILDKKTLPNELFLLPFVESSYIVKAESSKKAAGLWQFIPFTGSLMGLKIDVFRDERLNPEKSTEHATKFLKILYERYGDWNFALAAYNCGPGCVDKRIKENYETFEDNLFNFWSIYETFPKETQNYVAKFHAVFWLDRELTDFNMTPEIFEEEELFTYTLENPIPVSIISKASGLSYDKILEYNPELISGVTPPDIQNYQISLPISVKEIFEKKIVELKKEIQSGFIFHTLKSGETLSHLAVEYHTSSSSIMLSNKIKNPKELKIGQKLLIPIDPIKLGDRFTDKKSPLKINEKSDNKSVQKNIITYKIKKGETLWSISRDFNISLDDIKKINPFFNSKTLYVGQSLQLPTPKKSTTDPFLPKHKRVVAVNYNLKKGDSLWSVAIKFKTPLDELKFLNKIMKTSKLQIGMVLKMFVSSEIYEANKTQLKKITLQ